MSAQPADLEPRDAGPVRVLTVVPDPPREAPQRPTPEPAVETRVPALDRVAVTVLATPVGGLTAACIGQWWALGVWALIWVVLVAWTARGHTTPQASPDQQARRRTSA